MRRYFRITFSILAAMILLSGGLHRSNAQTLQFSQVLMVTTLATVPAGKVWKVESALFSPSFTTPPNISGTYTSTANFLVNSQIVTAAGIFVSGYHSGYEYDRAITSTLLTHFPLWLKESATLAAGTNIIGLSVVEFTVVP
jgi:hypothetical protein